MIPAIDTSQFALIHHVVAPRDPRRAVSTTHDPHELDHHARLTFWEAQVAAEVSPPSNTRVQLEAAGPRDQLERAELQAMQYSQAYEDMLANLSSQSPLPVVLDGVDSVASTLAIPLQDELLAAYSADHAQEVSNVVAGTYLHDELAVERAAQTKSDGAVNVMT